MHQLIHLERGILRGIPRKFDRSPRLDTVIMVEKAIYKHRNGSTITEIWRSLPKKTMWTTYVTILGYLEYSGKIHVENDKKVVWLGEKQDGFKKKELVVE